jgi:hypothetical protein
MLDSSVSGSNLGFFVDRLKAGFALRYINIFFTPSFVLLPLSPPISGIEVGKIIVVFGKYPHSILAAKFGVY